MRLDQERSLRNNFCLVGHLTHLVQSFTIYDTGCLGSTDAFKARKKETFELTKMAIT